MLMKMILVFLALIVLLLLILTTVILLLEFLNMLLGLPVRLVVGTYRLFLRQCGRFLLGETEIDDNQDDGNSTKFPVSDENAGVAASCSRPGPQQPQQQQQQQRSFRLGRQHYVTLRSTSGGDGGGGLLSYVSVVRKRPPPP